MLFIEKIAFKTQMKIIKRSFKLIRIAAILFLLFIAGRHIYINADYPYRLAEIEAQRSDFALAYKAANQPDEKKKVIFQATTYLENALIERIFPAWYGNPWSFTGDAAHPFDGRIACGAFVENTLKNMGFRLNDQMSAQPSENIIKNIVTDTTIERFSKTPLHAFIARVRELGEGIYIVGLDNHVGFLYHLNGKMRFVHSQGYLCVIAEIPTLCLSLKKSSYRVVGKLFDATMVERWLLNQPFPLKHDYFKADPP